MVSYLEHCFVYADQHCCRSLGQSRDLDKNPESNSGLSFDYVDSKTSNPNCKYEVSDGKNS